MSFTLERIITNAMGVASKCRHQFFTAEHILFCSFNNPMVAAIMKDCGADVSFIQNGLKKYLESKIPILPASINRPPQETIGFQSTMSRAVFYCIESKRLILDVGDILLGMLEEKQSYCSYYMRGGKIDRIKLISAATRNNAFQSDEAIFAAQQMNQQFVPGGIMQMQQGNTASTALQQFCVDVTAEAKAGKYDKIIGRESEIDRTIQVLCRRTKNNVLHIGDAGVGKTTIVQGLAQKIVSGKVCSALVGFSIFSLDVGFLLAGSRYRGDFEERVYSIIDDLKKRKKAILFIDEIHMIMGAGGGSSSVDAANMLKPILTDGNVRVIGSTTFEEYAKHFEKDRALNRRFQKIFIEEPSRDDAIKIVQGVLPKYAEYHNVRYSKDAVRSAVDLSIRYITDKRLPDKALDIIDEAASYAKIHSTGNGQFSSINLATEQYTTNKEKVKDENISTILNQEKAETGFSLFHKLSHPKKVPVKNAIPPIPVVNTFIIKKIVSKMAGVDVESVGNNERKLLRNLDTTLQTELFGQEMAITAVTNAIKKSRVGLKNPNKPDACFLFVGPTGVGKTELARLVASCLNINLLRFDMSEYQEKHTVSRLIGSPAGYIGHDEGGLLTDAVRKYPRSLVLFDEIEKADNDIYNILLQVMDYGFLTDSHGVKVDFRNTIIIFTSNTGSKEIERLKVGFSLSDIRTLDPAELSSNLEIDTTQEDATYKEACEKEFTSEFRNRLTAIVPFHQLSGTVVMSIVSKECTKLSKRFLTQKVHLAFTQECKEHIARVGYSKVYGARNIERTVEDLIATPLVDKVLFGELANGGYIVADVDNDKVVFAPKAASSLEKSASLEIAPSCEGVLADA